MKGLFLGLDIGSTASKCVIVTEDGCIAAKGMYPSGAGTVGPKTCVDEALAAYAVGASLADIRFSCATGYGRKLSDWTDIQVSELSCHARGAVELFEDVRTVIDIGGQDAKVLSIGKDGQLENFAMNDKCAAGTGRFLDVMASVFGCDVGELSAYDERSTQIASISSTCTVFAESEVISKLASGEDICNIAAGVHQSVVDRTYGLAQRVGVKPAVAMTGGVALNTSLRRRLEERIGLPVATSELAQYNGAYGAALLALERCEV